MLIVPNDNSTPKQWKVIIYGHSTDVEMAVEAIIENQAEAFLNNEFVASDDDELIATITLRWVDEVMLRLVRSIIENDFDYVVIKYIGVVENGESIA